MCPNVNMLMRYKPYYEQLTAFISAFSVQVQQQKTQDEEGSPHTAIWLYLKAIKWKWSEPRLLAPFEVTERTCTIRLKGMGDTLFHWSRCTLVYSKGSTLSEIRQALKDITDG